MTTYYKATAADGTTLTRSTVSRKYTHCVAAFFVPWKGTEPKWISQTWAGRPDLASKEARRLAARHSGAVAVLDAIEITRQEYQSLRAS